MKYRIGLSLLLAGAPISSTLASGEGGGGGMSLITPGFGLIFWTVVTFVALAFLMGKFAWKPLLSAIKEREKSIEDSLETARSDREEAEKLLEEHKALIAEANRERGQALEAARADGERLKEEILQEARNQREQMLKPPMRPPRVMATAATFRIAKMMASCRSSEPVSASDMVS